MNRREFLKSAALATGIYLAGGIPRALTAHAADGTEPPSPSGAATVYMTRDISPAGLMSAYRLLNRDLKSRTAVKLSMGEPGGHNYLAPSLIADLVRHVNGVFVDANTAYGGKRGTVKDHLQTARDHGFLDVAQVDILDADGDIRLPVSGGTHLKDVRVGAHFADYASILVLSHFKGHAMGGFGGALKNIAIGIASRTGKCLVHTAGRSETNAFDGPDKQEHFLESMAEAAEGMIRAKGADNMAYVSVMNRLSVDCDCDSHPAEPEMADIGILSSLDPVALDQACVDLVYAADEKDSASLRRRIEEKKGTHILTHAEKLGVGVRRYTLVDMDA